MDKGIFYLVCSVLIIAVVVLTGYNTSKAVASACVGKTTVEKVAVLVTPTVEPTATPAAFFKRVVPTVKK